MKNIKEIEELVEKRTKISFAFEQMLGHFIRNNEDEIQKAWEDPLEFFNDILSLQIGSKYAFCVKKIWLNDKKELEKMFTHFSQLSKESMQRAFNQTIKARLEAQEAEKCH